MQETEKSSQGQTLKIAELSKNGKIVNKTPEKCELKCDLKLYIKKIIKSEGLSDCKVDMQLIFTQGGNYMGELFKVVIQGKTTEGDKTLDIFVKTTIPDRKKMKILAYDSLFLTEIYAYKELSLIFIKLQEEFNVPEEERYKMVKYYDTGCATAIIMEDLMKRGYTVYDRFRVISLQFAEQAIKSLAKFHSLSFVIEKYRTDIHEFFIKPKKTLTNYNNEFTEFFKHVIDSAVDMIDCEEKKQKLIKYFKHSIDKLEYYSKDEGVGSGVLCHGDYRVNNILILEKDEQIVDNIPVDYQLLYYGHPLNDFFYFIYLCSDRKFREQKIEDLKDLYHNTMKKYLSYFDIDVEDVLPKKKLDYDFKTRRDIGLLYSVMFLPFVLAPENEIIDFNDAKMNEIVISKNDIHIKRANDFVDEFIELGYL